MSSVPAPQHIVQCEQCTGERFVEVVAWRIWRDGVVAHRMREERFFRCADCGRELRCEYSPHDTPLPCE